MIEEIGKVVAVRDRTAWIEVIRQSACATCSARKGCGQGVLARLGGGPAHVEADNPLSLAEGAFVVIGIPDSTMVKSALLAYLMPLLMMLGFALAATQLGWRESWVVISAILGLASGFGALWVYSRTHQRQHQYRPRILRLADVADSGQCGS